MGWGTNFRNFFIERDPDQNTQNGSGASHLSQIDSGGSTSNLSSPKPPAEKYWGAFVDGEGYNTSGSDSDFAARHQKLLSNKSGTIDKRINLKNITVNFQTTLKDPKAKKEFSEWLIMWGTKKGFIENPGKKTPQFTESSQFLYQWVKEHLGVDCLEEYAPFQPLQDENKGGEQGSTETLSKEKQKQQDAQIMAMLVAYIQHQKKERHGYTWKTRLAYGAVIAATAAVVLFLWFMPGLWEVQYLLWAVSTGITSCGAIYTYKAYDRVKTLGKGIALLMTIATVALLIVNIKTFPGGAPLWLLGLGFSLAPFSFYANYTLFEVDVPNLLRAFIVELGYWKRTLDKWWNNTVIPKTTEKEVSTPTLALRLGNLGLNLVLLAAASAGAYYLTAAFVFSLFGLLHLPLTPAPLIMVYAWVIFTPIFLCNLALIFRRGLRIKRALYEAYSGTEYQEGSGEFKKIEQTYTEEEAKNAENPELAGKPKPIFTGWRGILFGFILGLTPRWKGNVYSEGNTVEVADNVKARASKVFWFIGKFILFMGTAAVVAWFGQSSMVEGIAHKALAFATHIGSNFGQFASAADNWLCTIAIWTRVSAVFYSAQQLLFQRVGKGWLGGVDTAIEKLNHPKAKENEENTEQQPQKSIGQRFKDILQKSKESVSSSWKGFKEDMYHKRFLVNDKDDLELWEKVFGNEAGDGAASHIRYAANLRDYQERSSGIQKVYAAICAFCSSCVYNPVMNLIGALLNAGENAAVNAAGAIDKGASGWKEGMDIGAGAASSKAMTLSSMITNTPYQKVLSKPQSLESFVEAAIVSEGPGVKVVGQEQQGPKNDPGFDQSSTQSFAPPPPRPTPEPQNNCTKVGQYNFLPVSY